LDIRVRKNRAICLQGKTIKLPLIPQY